MPMLRYKLRTLLIVLALGPPAGGLAYIQATLVHSAWQRGVDRQGKQDARREAARRADRLGFLDG